MKILNFIKDYWAIITFFLGMFSTFFLFAKSMIQATKCSLRNDILDIFEKAESRGNKIKKFELEAIQHSSEVYFKLKGNSFVKSIVNRVENFELID